MTITADKRATVAGELDRAARHQRHYANGVREKVSRNAAAVDYPAMIIYRDALRIATAETKAAALELAAVRVAHGLDDLLGHLQRFLALELADTPGDLMKAQVDGLVAALKTVAEIVQQHG